jgi:hypothetical protein
METSMPARYVGGPPQIELLPEGREVRLLNDFSFYDFDDFEWYVPRGAEVDGASIPQIFWSLIGGPFEGRYRDASIVHDWFCDTRQHSWQATHRMFYEAMLVSGAGSGMAKVMYFAVRWGGPRWVSRVSRNIDLLSTLRSPKGGGFTGIKFSANGVPDSRLPIGDFLSQNGITIWSRTKQELIVSLPIPNPADMAGHTAKNPVDVATHLDLNSLSLDDIDRIADATT